MGQISGFHCHGQSLNADNSLTLKGKTLSWREILTVTSLIPNLSLNSIKRLALSQVS